MLSALEEFFYSIAEFFDILPLKKLDDRFIKIIFIFLKMTLVEFLLQRVHLFVRVKSMEKLG